MPAFFIAVLNSYLTDKYFDIVWATPPGTPQNGAPKNYFFEQLNLKFFRFFFDVSRYLTEKYFAMVWGCQPLPGIHPHGHPKNQLFQKLHLGCQFFVIHSRYTFKRHTRVIHTKYTFKRQIF